MSEVSLIALYPHPTDPDRFDADYQEHLQLLHQKTGIPADERPYRVTRMMPTPDGPAPYYQMFSLPFPSAKALQEAMGTPEMQAVAADAVRISSGGPPVILVGAD